MIFGFIIVGFLSFDFYYKTDHIETTDTDEYVTSKRHTLDTVNETSEDTLHISMKTIYLIASGGTIDATCDNGYSIIIESQDNQNSGTWRRIRYTFSTRSEYMDALEYIKAKGSRWIINHQFEVEDDWDSKLEITFEGAYVNDGNEYRSYVNLELTSIKKDNGKSSIF